VSGDGATVRSILNDIGEDLLWRKQGELVKCSEQKDDFNSCSVRFTVGKEGCKVNNHGWVPDGLKQIGLPENVGTFGAPWMHYVACGAFLNSPEDMPFPGFGKFLIGMKGAFWLISWPGKHATDIAMPLEKAFDQVGMLKKDEFTAFFKNNVFHCLIQKDTVAWIPYSHCSTLISLQGQEHDTSIFLTVPYMSVGLLHKAPSAPRTEYGKIVEECCNTLSGTKKHQPFSLFVAWFRASLEEERNDEEEIEEMADTQALKMASDIEVEHCSDDAMPDTGATTLEG